MFLECFNAFQLFKSLQPVVSNFQTYFFNPPWGNWSNLTNMFLRWVENANYIEMVIKTNMLKLAGVLC